MTVSARETEKQEAVPGRSAREREDHTYGDGTRAAVRSVVRRATFGRKGRSKRASLVARHITIV